MHRRAIAVTLLSAGIAISACAQHGGSHVGPSGGHSFGFASHVESSFHASSTFAGHSSLTATPPSSTSRYAALNSDQRSFVRPPLVGYSDHHSAGFRTERNDLNARFRRPYHPFYGLGVPYNTGWIGSGYLGFPDPNFYDGPTYAAPQPPDNPLAPQYDSPPASQADAALGPPHRSSYRRPPLVQELAPEAPVTLIFKDGRPTEQIQNYILTRTTLYVQEQRLREIPVDQLDLAATQKLNQAGGVDFQLPAPHAVD